MSYDAYERSAAGEPVELYRWLYGDIAYHYTSAQADQSYLGETFAAAPIRRGAISQGDTIERASLEIAVAQDHPVATLFRASTPAQRVTATLWRRHLADADAEYIVLWQGRVRSCIWEEATARLVHEPIWTTLRRAGLRRTWGRTCPYVLGDDECRVNLATYTVSGTVASLSGLTAKVSAASGYPAGYFAGGTLAVTVGGVPWQVMILAHRTDTLTLHLPIPGLAAGASVALTPGCSHTWTGAAGCRERFGNGVNFGAFPFTPRLSPHGGTRLY